MNERENYPPAAEVLDADGESCATLTPLIRAKIKNLKSGSVLEVRTDDPTARESIASWSRLTGNEIVAAVNEDELRTRFFLRKK